MTKLALFAFVIFQSAWGDTIVGTIVQIKDGDTVVVMDETKQQHTIRFNGVDCPEKNQAFGNRSKQELIRMLSDKPVTVTWTKHDIFCRRKKDKSKCRKIGKIVQSDKDINLAMIENGMCWYYRHYAKDVDPEDRPVYSKAEMNAKATKLGLWSEPNPTAPWEFRKKNRKKKRQKKN